MSVCGHLANFRLAEQWGNNGTVAKLDEYHLSEFDSRNEPKRDFRQEIDVRRKGQGGNSGETA